MYQCVGLRAHSTWCKSTMDGILSHFWFLPCRDHGIGLAAPQVGVNARVMVFSETGVRGEGKEYVLVNPTIVEHSTEEVDFEEGCLSFPQLYAFVRV